MRFLFVAAAALASATVGINQYTGTEDVGAVIDDSPLRFGTLPLPQPASPDDGSPESLIRRVAAKYGVPAGALYGIWSVESSRLNGGWGTGKGWLMASDIIKDGGACTRKYGHAWCNRHWRALQTICFQTHRDGSRVCDPYQVRTSYALAMGPMQHIPAEVVRYGADGSPAWTSRADDFDGDGVVDPHSLPDAMAMAARFLREAHAKNGNWVKSANLYYGSQEEGYAEGTAAGFKGVTGYWNDWCLKYGCTDD